MINDFIHRKFDSSLDSKDKSKASKKAKNLKNVAGIIKKLSDDEPKLLNPEKNETEIFRDDAESVPHKHNFADTIKEKIQEFVGHLDHVPAFLKDNEFIHTGYRIGFSTPKKVLKSLFMVHNESVNIWSHLGGAILLIILCVFLCFSVSSIDTQNLKQFVNVEVKELFEPLYDRLPDFTVLEHGISEKLSQTKDDITKFGENTMMNLEYKLEAITNEIEQVKENISPEAIGKLLNQVKGQLDTLSDTLKGIKDSVLDVKKLEGTSNSLKQKLNELQTELINKVDSSDFDWIDIYKYIKPTYSTSVSLKDGHILMPISRWPIIVFLLSAVFCLLCSAVFHLFYCLSQRANEILLRLDYAGISILITGSCFPPLVYGFYCQSFYAKFYLTIIGVTSIVVFFVSLGDKIHSQPYKKVKSLMYGGLGVFAGLPMLHLSYLTITMSDTSNNLNFVTSMPYYITMGVCYLGGLTIYTTKCPERFSPGKFDIIGHSHQIWHICVLLGVIFTYFGAFDNYYTRIKIPCIDYEL